MLCLGTSASGGVKVAVLLLVCMWDCLGTSPSITVNSQSFLQEHLQALSSAVPHWGCDGCTLLLGTQGLEAILGALKLLFSFPWEAGQGEGVWVPMALAHPLRHCLLRLLLCFVCAACSLPFLLGSIAESKALYDTLENTSLLPNSITK